ncbi:hypothetical protein DL765_007900 [Monosporascus sp. GIB2]|nr:hypothetical protein DL765_007900 [Monosporascus sp. GIB2]
MARVWLAYFCALAVTPLTTLAAATDQKVLTPGESNSHDPDLQKVKHELVKAEIIPTGEFDRLLMDATKPLLVKTLIFIKVVDEFLPSFILDVEWSSDVYASLGNTLKPKKVQDQPTFSVIRSPGTTGSAAANLTYTITLTDPDAPSRDNPKWAEMCHFIATGLKLSASDPSTSTSSELKDIMPWKPPGPPPKTGKHRYVFLLFAPANGTTEPLNLTKPEDRQHWGTGKERHGVRDWALDNGLAPVVIGPFITYKRQED